MPKPLRSLQVFYTIPGKTTFFSPGSTGFSVHRHVFHYLLLVYYLCMNWKVNFKSRCLLAQDLHFNSCVQTQNYHGAIWTVINTDGKMMPKLFKSLKVFSIIPGKTTFFSPVCTGFSDHWLVFHYHCLLVYFCAWTSDSALKDNACWLKIFTLTHAFKPKTIMEDSVTIQDNTQYL